jgi:hypothetical protein
MYTPSTVSILGKICALYKSSYFFFFLIVFSLDALELTSYLNVSNLIVNAHLVGENFVQRAQRSSQLLALVCVRVHHVHALSAVRMRLTLQRFLPAAQEVGHLAEEFLPLALDLGVHVTLDAFQLPPACQAPDTGK